MKILDQAVLSAAEARPSVQEWECSLEDWLTAGHPGDARKYLVRDGNVELRPSPDCPKGEIREAKPPKCARRWVISPYHYECYRPSGHIGLCVAANGVEIPGPTDPEPNPKCEWCGTRKNGSNRCCGEELRQRIGELSESVIRLNGALRTAGERIADVHGCNLTLRTDLKSAMTCSAVTNGPLGPIRCERLRGDGHGQKHVGGGREWEDDFSGPEFDCDECKEKDAKVVGLERDLRELRAGISADRETILRDRDDARRVRDQRWADAKAEKQRRREAEVKLDALRAELLRESAGGERCSTWRSIGGASMKCVRIAGHSEEHWWQDERSMCGLRWLDAIGWHECGQAKNHSGPHGETP